MKHLTSIAIASAFVAIICAQPAFAVDYASFKGQSCKDLAMEMEELDKAEKQASEAMEKTKDKESRDKGLAVASAILFGFGWWSSEDHSNTNNILAEIRQDKKLVSRAFRENKCAK